MIYKLQDTYYIISDGEHIGFYNLLEAKFDVLLKVDNKKVRKMFSMLNRPFKINDFPETERTFVKKILNKYFDPYFETIDKTQLVLENHKYQCINDFLEINRRAFDLDLQGLTALVKETINYTSYCFVTDLDEPNLDLFSGYTIKHKRYEHLNEQDFDWYNTIFIVDSQSLTKEQIRQFEKTCLKSQAIRMYVREDRESIVIGPTLIGEEFGCLFCDGQSDIHFSNDGKDSGCDSFSTLTSSLISTELLKIGRKIVSALIDDNTITKGKYMKLSRYNLEANEYEIKPDVACQVCDFVK